MEVGEVRDELRVEHPSTREGQGERVGEGEDHLVLVSLVREDGEDQHERADGKRFAVEVSMKEGLSEDVEDHFEASRGVGGQADEGQEGSVEGGCGEGCQGGDVGVEGGSHVGDGAGTPVAQGEEGVVEDPVGEVDYPALCGEHRQVDAG